MITQPDHYLMSTLLGTTFIKTDRVQFLSEKRINGTEIEFV